VDHVDFLLARLRDEGDIGTLVGLPQSIAGKTLVNERQKNLIA
jgi:hypothetical protein